MPYLWFHAFDRRDSMAAVLSVLRGTATPLGTGGTAENEEVLGITPNCVYAYLGQTFDEFGTCAVSLGLPALNGGQVSPFDTGGLVDHLAPVNGWSDDAKRAYLGHYSWPAEQLPGLLNVYPSPAGRPSYLRGERPVQVGPHEAFQGPPEASRVAAIWQNGNRASAWLWEGRAPQELQIGPHLVRWSCPHNLYTAILRHHDDVADDAERAWLDSLMPRYVRGGVSHLVAEMLATQEAV